MEYLLRGLAGPGPEFREHLGRRPSGPLPVERANLDREVTDLRPDWMAGIPLQLGADVNVHAQGEGSNSGAAVTLP